MIIWEHIQLKNLPSTHSSAMNCKGIICGFSWSLQGRAIDQWFFCWIGCDWSSICIHCDNQNAIHLSKYSMYHEKTKHIDVRLYFIRNIVEKGKANIIKVHTSENPIDMIIKFVPLSNFQHCLDFLIVQVDWRIAWT